MFEDDIWCRLFVQALKERTTQITSEAVLYWLHDTGLGFREFIGQVVTRTQKHLKS